MAHQSGFHSANMMIKKNCKGTFQVTEDAISQLATATASYRGTVTTLTVTNTKLATQLEASQEYIKKLKEEIAELKEKMKPFWQGQRPAIDQTIRQATIIIVGRMVIRFTRITQAQRARHQRKEIIPKRL
jgi:predicted RNase H-like nuclease (RuvC/YqgF family)